MMKCPFGSLKYFTVKINRLYTRLCDESVGIDSTSFLSNAFHQQISMQFAEEGLTIILPW